MSNTTTEAPNAAAHDPHCTGIQHIIQPGQRDLGGFSVRRVLPDQQQAMIGPWIFFDHMGPAEFAAGSGIDVRPHPHINLATVTYLFDGEIHHRDSLGNDEIIRPGDVNLMVAGRGIVHSERTDPARRAQAHRLDGLQLWLALPEDKQEIEPAFYHYDSDEIPGTEVNGVAVRVMMGEAFGLRSPVRTHSPILYFEARLNAGQSLHLPSSVSERGLYVVQGDVRIDQTRIEPFSMAVLQSAAEIEIHAETDASIALVGGEPVGPRFIWWNFVSSRRERIELAKADWREGRFPSVPGDEAEFIPLPDDH